MFLCVAAIPVKERPDTMISDFSHASDQEKEAFYAAIRERINSDNHFLQSSRMRVCDVRDGFATVEMDVDEQILNIYNKVHGGALFSLADTAAGAASFTCGRESVTLSASINYIRPGTGGKLTAHATRISSGRTTGVYEVFIYNDQEKLLCSALFTMYFTA